ncbi:MAG: HAMP domain-containing histidine kinase [Subdoligranulum sp.]|nr:HAMP domain-containing histidine kinase [Subdoligranulum sp.]
MRRGKPQAHTENAPQEQPQPACARTGQPGDGQSGAGRLWPGRGRTEKHRAGNTRTAARPARGIVWKLTAFILLLCVLLLVLVTQLSIQLLEPMYNRRVLAELNRTADHYAAILQKYDTFVTYDENGAIVINSALMDELRESGDLLKGKCLDIADASCSLLVGSHQLQGGQCLLHPLRVNTAIFGEPETKWDSMAAVNLRATVFVEGDLHLILPDDDVLPGIDAKAGARQMVVCRNIENRYSLILSTDLERVEQAADVMRMQMPIIAAILLAVSVAASIALSRWFTRPILAVSDAAREMAKGNYAVRVTPRTNDELGALAENFNTMAREVERTAELQRDLIANVSHDLRTPLTLIKGYAETVRDLTGDDAEKREAQLSVIVDETDRLSALVNSVMELSRYSSGAQKPNLVRFDLAQLCDEAASRYENLCAQNGYTLVLETGEPCPVTADPDGMSRVVHNLLANAMHHIGPDGQVCLRAKRLADGSVRVEVEDHGAGIAQEDLPHLFDKYYRARADAGKVGTGLGLSITKAILIQHGFAFGVESELGKGSIFWFAARP